MKTIEKKTSNSSPSCVILWQNTANACFGHFFVENLDTEQKKSQIQVALRGRWWWETRHAERRLKGRVSSYFEEKNIHFLKGGILNSFVDFLMETFDGTPCPYHNYGEKK